MAIKYLLEYKDITNTDWSVSIDIPDYTGDPIPILGVGKDVLSIDWLSQTSDDPHAQHVIPSTAKLQVYSHGLDLDELMLTPDLTYRVTINRSGVLFWQGWLSSDGIQKSRQSVNYPVTLTATDGLDKLSGITFSRGANFGNITVDGVVSDARCPMNTLRLIFQRSEMLNNPLPIKWFNSNKSKQYPNADGLAGKEELDVRGDLTHANKDCFWWIENIVKSQYCWLYQYGGYWYIVNYNDLIVNEGVLNGYEIGVSSGALTATPITEDFNTTIDTTITNDGYYMVKKPLGRVDVTYNDTTFDDNVIPNPSFDIVSTGFPIYWHMKSGLGKISLEDPLNGEYTGYSAQVDNSWPSYDDDWLTFGSIPMDSHVLFKNATLGFKFVGISGYTLDGDGYITTGQIKMRVKYTGYHNGILKNLYLNEFGYWSGFGLVGDGLVINEVSSNADEVFITFGGSSSKIGQHFTAQYTENTPNVPPVDIYKEYTFSSVLSINDAVAAIASATGGSSVGNVLYYGVENPTNASASITGASDDTEDIRFIIPELKHNDIVDVQFQSRGNSGNIKIPDCGDLHDAITSGAGRLSIEFFAKKGVVFQVDDFYFKVENNHDLFEIDTPLKSDKEEYELGISSGFSGHMHSSYMKGYSKAQDSMLWNDDVTLTEQYGINAIKWMNTPNQIFQGTAVGMIGMNSFIELDGKKYISLGNSINCHTNQTKVLLFEAKNDAVSYSITHKKSEG